MSQITIQCRLVASEASRQQLWQLMAERNTPLINELLVQVSQHPDFETWQRKGKLPAGTVQHLCKPLRTDSRFEGQPGRFYTSASKLVEYIYKSWFKLQQRRQQKLEGQRHWLEMLKSDEGSPTHVRMHCSGEQSTPIAPMWFSSFFEKDRVFLTKGEIR